MFEEQIKSLSDRIKRESSLIIFKLNVIDVKTYHLILISYAILDFINYVIHKQLHIYLSATIYTVIGVYIFGLVGVILVRKLILSFMQILGLYKGPRSVLSISFVYADLEKYNNFAKKAYQYVFRPKYGELPIIIVGVGIYALTQIADILFSFSTTNDLFYSIFNFNGTFIYPISIISKLINWIYWTIFSVLIISFFALVARMLIILLRIEKDKRYFTIYKTIEWLKQIKDQNYVKDDTLYSSNIYNKGNYTLFLYSMKSITEFLSKITIFILVIGIGYSFGGTLKLLVGNMNIYRFYITIIIGLLCIIFALAVFILPQLKYHNLMATYKKSINYILKIMYERSMINFINTHDSVKRQKLWLQIQAIQKTLNYTQQLQTWPFSVQQLTHILGGIIILLELIAIQLIQFFFL